MLPMLYTHRVVIEAAWEKGELGSQEGPKKICNVYLSCLTQCIIEKPQNLVYISLDLIIFIEKKPYSI